MKHKRVYTDYLKDIIHYAEKIEQFVVGLDFDHFASNEEKTLAVIHALQIISEAVNCLPSSLKKRYPDVPWADIVGMRNIIVHGYSLVDLKVVWKTVQESISPLHRAVTNILKDVKQSKNDT